MSELCPKCKRPITAGGAQFRPGDCFHTPERDAPSTPALGELETEVCRLQVEISALKRENSKSQEERDLEQNALRAALDLRKISNRLRGYNAPSSAWARETMSPAKRLDEALDKLAALRGEQ